MARTKKVKNDTTANLGFEAKHAELAAQEAEGAHPKTATSTAPQGIFWVQKETRWKHLSASTPHSTIGTLVDDAMAAIEHDNPPLKGVLAKDFARPGLDDQRMGQILNPLSDIALGDTFHNNPLKEQQFVRPWAGNEILRARVMCGSGVA